MCIKCHTRKPENVVIEDVLNEMYSWFQRFTNLPKRKTTKSDYTESLDSNRNFTTHSEDLSKASFSFEAFPEDIIEIKETCELQCNLQAANAANFIFKDLIDISTVTAPITRRDYIFNTLMEEKFYICQYKKEENFGGMKVLITLYKSFNDNCIHITNEHTDTI